jgi:hypothetical protein
MTAEPTTREQAEAERAENIQRQAEEIARLADEHIQNLPPYPTVTQEEQA